MKCALTGASGFLGSHITDVLIQKGVDVRALVRPTSNLRWLRDKPIQVLRVPLDDNKRLKIEHSFNIPQGHVQQQTDTRRQRLQEPDMGHRTGQLNMSHAFPAHFGQRHLDTAFFTYDATVLQPLILPA